MVSNNFANAPFDEAVYKIQSTDNWESGKIRSVKKIEGGVFPTTLTEVGDSVYVNYSYLPDLIMSRPSINQFKIQKIICAKSIICTCWFRLTHCQLRLIKVN